MKPIFSAVMTFVLLYCTCSAVFAAELLDVKPIITGSAVAIEISADIPMTFTYYKIPGQARAVVDVAEADPEKVEPLIVVNKGAISSISVDKALISGFVVSRIIFNLVSEADIFVSASPDRKRLMVTFGGATGGGAKPEPAQQAAPAPLPQPEIKAEAPAPVPATLPVAAAPEEDPLGLEEPAAQPTAPAAPPTTAATSIPEAATVPADTPVPPPAAPIVIRIPKLAPVTPAIAAPVRLPTLTVRDITAGDGFIEILANQPVADYKATQISEPSRLIIDIPADKINQKAQTITINKFGVSKARIGIAPKNIRIVLDSGRAEFPAHTISNTPTGLRIHFK
jgi:hypothetical protein